MKVSTIHQLCCPFCSATLKPSQVKEETNQGIHFGTVLCTHCAFEYPIVAGVLILTPPFERVEVFFETQSVRMFFQGPQVHTLCELITAGHTTDALSRLLNPSYPDADLLFYPRKKATSPNSAQPSDFTPQSWHPSKTRTLLNKFSRKTKFPRLLNYLGQGTLLPATRRRFAKFLVAHHHDLTAAAVFDLYYSQYSRSEMANYFTFRYGQPRYLSALSMAYALKQQGGPILDLACGAGHLTNYLSTGEPQRPVVGMDRDFVRLYIAKNFVAPQADFICKDCDQPLPFPDASLGAVFCSDAFAYFLNKAGTLREMQRVTTADGVLGISRIANRTQNPHNGGYPLSIEGYAQLCAPANAVIVGEDELMQAYLRKQGPDFRPRDLDDTIRQQVMLCILMAKNKAALRDYGAFPVYPHSEGQWVLNPIYTVERHTPHGLQLRFQFPSTWYAFEDAQYLDYAPQTVDISQAVLADLQAGRRTAAVEQLIAQFVVIGVSERYLGSPLRSFT